MACAFPQRPWLGFYVLALWDVPISGFLVEPTATVWAWYKAIVNDRVRLKRVFCGLGRFPTGRHHRLSKTAGLLLPLRHFLWRKLAGGLAFTLVLRDLLRFLSTQR